MVSASIALASFDLLDHAHNTARSGVLPVRLEAWGRRRPRRLLLLADSEKRRLVVIALEDGQGLRKQLLRRALVRHGRLELLVLLLAVLSRTLELHLHLRDLCLQGLNGISEGLDG